MSDVKRWTFKELSRSGEIVNGTEVILATDYDAEIAKLNRVIEKLREQRNFIYKCYENDDIQDWSGTAREFIKEDDAELEQAMKGGRVSRAPWAKEQAEQWANDFANVVWDNSPRNIAIASHRYQAFLAGLAKAAEMIEECPTVYGQNHFHVGEVFGVEERDHDDTHQAKLVGVKPIEDEDDIDIGANYSGDDPRLK